MLRKEAPRHSAAHIVGFAFDKTVDEVGSVEVEQTVVDGDVDGLAVSEALDMEGGVALELVDIAAGVAHHVSHAQGVGGETRRIQEYDCTRYGKNKSFHADGIHINKY